MNGNEPALCPPDASTSTSTQPQRASRNRAGSGYLGATALALLAVAAMGLSVGNQLAHDDIPIISTNPAVHAPSLEVFRTPYWPKGFTPDLYRPFGTLSLGLQWVLGEGAAWPVHLVSLLMYTGLVLAVWGLARRLLPSVAAWLVAALFSVHPVHVEAVATGVNQGEIMVALILTLCTMSYIDGRRDAQFGVRRAVGIAVAFPIACLYKEHAVVLPGLLAAAELTVLCSARRLGSDFRLLVRLYATLVIETGVFLFVRTLVLGDFAGSFTAEALQGLGVGARLVTMLGVVPFWARLLIWPAHLQADYSPGEIVGATAMGSMQWTGLILVVVAVASAFAARRRAPVWTFGILWFAVSLVPVANILIPTGIVLAERTLLLPSIGILVGAGGLLAVFIGTRSPRPMVRRAAVGVITTAIGLGIVRSALRMQVWNTNDYLWQRTLEDAPLSYRAHHARAQYLFRLGQRRQAEDHFRRAIELFPGSFQPRIELADAYRRNDLCEPAMVIYLDALTIAPQRADARLSLIACMLWEGRYGVAIRQARVGRGWDIDDGYFMRALAAADSAERVDAPRHTVRLRLPPHANQSNVGSIGGAGPSAMP